MPDFTAVCLTSVLGLMRAIQGSSCWCAGGRQHCTWNIRDTTFRRVQDLLSGNMGHYQARIGIMDVYVVQKLVILAISRTDKTSCFSRQRTAMSSAPCWAEVTCTWVSRHHDQRMASSQMHPTDSSLGWRKGRQEAVPLQKNHTAKPLFGVCFTFPLERSCVLAGALHSGVCFCSTAVKPGPRSGQRQNIQSGPCWVLFLRLGSELPTGTNK